MANRFLSLLKSSRPLLVASLNGDDLSARFEEARFEHADVAEIRMDLWGDVLRDDMVSKLESCVQKAGVPLLVTFRGGMPLPSWWEASHWQALTSAAAIDVEWSPKYPWRNLVAEAKKVGVALVISHHDFKRTPSEASLASIAKQAFAKGADVFKVATQTTRPEDLRRLINFRRRLPAAKPVAFMGMGPYGPVSRLVAPLFDSALVYGYLGSPTAQGQLPYRELRMQTLALFPSYSQSRVPRK